MIVGMDTDFKIIGMANIKFIQSMIDKNVSKKIAHDYFCLKIKKALTDVKTSSALSFGKLRIFNLKDLNLGPSD